MANTNTFDGQFYNPEFDLNDEYSNEIHMHKIMRGRKSDIIIQGLVFKSEIEAKDFVAKVKTKYGIGGCYKMQKDFDEKNKIFIFKGDKRDDIRDLLISEYNKDDDFIKYHG